MFSPDPEFKVIKCEPMTLSFGGIRYSLEDLHKPYTPSQIADMMEPVIQSACTPFKESYGIEAVVKRPKKSSVSAILKPANAKLKDQVLFDLRIHNKTLDKHKGGFLYEMEKLCDAMVVKKLGTMVYLHDDNGGFYLMHDLKERLDGESAANMFRVLGKLMVVPTSNDLSIRKEISPECVRVDVDIAGHKSRDYLV
jgi:hypothetical protein